MIKLNVIDSWEKELYRRMYLLPRDLKRDAITNVARRRDPTSTIV